MNYEQVLSLIEEKEAEVEALYEQLDKIVEQKSRDDYREKLDKGEEFDEDEYECARDEEVNAMWAQGQREKKAKLDRELVEMQKRHEEDTREGIARMRSEARMEWDRLNEIYPVGKYPA